MKSPSSGTSSSSQSYFCGIFIGTAEDPFHLLKPEDSEPLCSESKETEILHWRVVRETGYGWL